MHNIMLVDMIDTLQDLTNAMTTEKEKGTDRERDVSCCSSSQKTNTKPRGYENGENSDIIHIKLSYILKGRPKVRLTKPCLKGLRDEHQKHVYRHTGVNKMKPFTCETRTVKINCSNYLFSLLSQNAKLRLVKCQDLPISLFLNIVN